MKLSRLKNIFVPQSLLESINTRLANLDARLDLLETGLEDVVVEAKLKRHLPTIFPDQAAVDVTVQRIEQNEPKPADQQTTYTQADLPFHINDYAWLAAYTATVLNQPQAKVLVTAPTVQAFIQTSDDFNQVRQDYIQRLIKAYIKHTTDEIVHLDHYTPENNPNYLGIIEYDKIVPHQVLTKTQALGIEPRTVRVALETNADLWRKPAMLKTFRDFYYPYVEKPQKEKFLDQTTDLWQLKNSHEELWLQRREYEYYQDHQWLIDELGTATPNMKPNQAEKARLADALVYHERKRREFMDDEQFRAKLTRRNDYSHQDTHTL